MNPIYQRRSIRLYENKKISKEALQSIIKAGMNAPSAGDQQPWQFMIIDQPLLLQELSQIHARSGEVIKNAPVAVLVCGDLSLEKYEGFWSLDCAAATQNILLEIVNTGLGGVWISLYPREQRVKAAKVILKLPEQIMPFALVTLGYARENPGPKNLFYPGRIKYNSWIESEQMNFH